MTPEPERVVRELDVVTLRGTVVDLMPHGGAIIEIVEPNGHGHFVTLPTHTLTLSDSLPDPEEARVQRVIEAAREFKRAHTEAAPLVGVASKDQPWTKARDALVAAVEALDAPSPGVEREERCTADTPAFLCATPNCPVHGHTEDTEEERDG